MKGVSEMSVSTAIVAATLTASIVHPQVGIAAGPYKALASPGATVAQRVTNNGTIPETIYIGSDEIGRTGTGACGFTHRAPLVRPSVSSVYLRPGESRDLSVKVAPSGPSGYHTLTVDYTVTGSGNVKVAEGVATVIGVRYPGSAPESAPCVAIAKTSAPSHGVNPVIPGAATVGLAALAALALRRRIRRNRSRKASA
jgi:hypothetical protein